MYSSTHHNPRRLQSRPANTISQECYTIEHRINNHFDVNNDLTDTQPMDRDTILKLDDPTAEARYNFKLEDFYQSVAACNNGNFEAVPNLLFDGQNLPKCFYSIHFIRADSTVCSVDQNSVPREVLDDLQITKEGGCPAEDPCNTGCVNE